MRAIRKMKAAFRVAAAAAGMSLIVAPGMATPVFADGHDRGPSTATPIEHVVVIFQENVSFDHYFATYPYAANTDGTTFNPADGTPSVNGLGTLIEGEPSGRAPEQQSQRWQSGQWLERDQSVSPEP
jgi:phospholipase C